jgi:excisionase family DNA binding protein
MPEALSIEEACRVFGIGRTKLYELIRGHVLPTIKVGKRRLVRPDTLRRVVASLEHTGVGRAS